MKRLARLPGVFLLTGLCVWSGCKRTDPRDFMVSTQMNLSHTHRATVIIRQYFVENRESRGPTTYVLVDSDMSRDGYENGENFKSSEIVMKPSQCGPVRVEWVTEEMLKVACEKCGLSLASVGHHADRIGSVQIEYEGFPEASSWEAAPRAK